MNLKFPCRRNLDKPILVSMRGFAGPKSDARTHFTYLLCVVDRGFNIRLLLKHMLVLVLQVLRLAWFCAVYLLQLVAACEWCWLAVTANATEHRFYEKLK